MGLITGTLLDYVKYTQMLFQQDSADVKIQHSARWLLEGLLFGTEVGNQGMICLQLTQKISLNLQWQGNGFHTKL